MSVRDVVNVGYACNTRVWHDFSEVRILAVCEEFVFVPSGRLTMMGFLSGFAFDNIDYLLLLCCFLVNPCQSLLGMQEEKLKLIAKML